ncbi:MAG: hypothetical protein ACRD3G_08695 [Vicinamibacterales bacterium]
MSNTPPDRDTLLETLKVMARRDAGRGVSPEVEVYLGRHVRALGTSRRRTRFAWLAAAASLLIAVGLTRFTMQERESGSDQPSVVGMAPSSDGFLPLPNAHLPIAEAHVVRMTVARSSLVAFGLDPGGPDTPDVVLADILVGHDGIARSVRFVGLATKEELER